MVAVCEFKSRLLPPPKKKEKMAKDTLYKVCDGVKLSAKSDKVWLHFESKSGQKCSFCVDDKFPKICSAAIRGWAHDMMKASQKKQYE